MNRKGIFIYIESERNEKYTIYIEENIYGYDNYITHLNTESFVMYEDMVWIQNFGEIKNNKYPCSGILIGNEENDTFLSFKYDQREIKINKKGEIIVKQDGRDKKCKMKGIKIIEKKEDKKEIKEKEIHPLNSFSIL